MDSKIINTTHFATNAKIIIAYCFQMTQKSLMKTKSRLNKKSSTQHSFAADVEIISVHGL
jgi:hypothetical protein